ncbi:MAG: hypothetical protein IKF80_10355 [Erysipelotrichaceae bacterium]|nr:hypothetical protein [Erysipelotrichaceae bacterium]
MPEKQIWEKTQNELSESERLIVENSDSLYLAVYNNTVDQMYELTDDMKRFMKDYPYRSQDEIRDPKNIKVMAHYFNPVCGQDWIVTEYYDYQNDEHYFYGAARLFDDIGWEWGVLPSLEELKSIDLGPMTGHLRIERDLSVEPYDNLYDVMMSIDENGLYDLGLMERKLDDIDNLIDIEKQKFALLKNIVDEETYNKVINYLCREEKLLDDVFDVDRYYYDRDKCFDEETINEYYETHEYNGLDYVREDIEMNVQDEREKEFFRSLIKDDGKDFGKEM